MELEHSPESSAVNTDPWEPRIIATALTGTQINISADRLYHDIERNGETSFPVEQLTRIVDRLALTNDEETQNNPEHAHLYTPPQLDHVLRIHRVVKQLRKNPVVQEYPHLFGKLIEQAGEQERELGRYICAWNGITGDDVPKPFRPHKMPTEK